MKRSPRKTGTPRNLVHMLLCRQMSSISNEPVAGTLCAEGAEREPSKHDCRFCKKSANFSPPLLITLECPYEKFASERFFSLHRPLSDGAESMRISAPYPEIGPPNLEKCGAWYKHCMHNFFRFFWLLHSLSEVLSSCRILEGGNRFPRYWEKQVLLSIWHKNANFGYT